MRYLHYAPREEDAELVAEAFRIERPAEPSAKDADLQAFVPRRPKMPKDVPQNVPGRP
jgi:hypothetical protein